MVIRMSEVLEILMLVSFGLSWPLNLVKAIRAKSTKGISLAFYFLIFAGYIAGIFSKFTNAAYMAAISEKWYVLMFYFINLITVGCNILVYFRNKKFD